MPAQLNYYIFQMMRPLLTYGQALSIFHPLLLLLTYSVEVQKGIVWNVACKSQATEFEECEKESVLLLSLSLSLSFSAPSFLVKLGEITSVLL